MSQNIKFFLISFLVSIPLWWGINVFEKDLEDFFFAQYYQPSPQVFLAQVLLQSHKNIEKETPEIAAVSAISVKIDKRGQQKILFEKNSEKILPIASLTKLMAASVVLENYDLSQELMVSKKAIGQPEAFGQLRVGEKLSVENLLYLMLIESSNDAAFALSELIGEGGFVELMNLEAKYLGLKNTHFADPAGYSPENYSTVKDLVKFTKYLLEEKPQILEISRLSEFNLYDPDGVFHHKLLNTNEILGEIPEIIGGKTGYTPEAGECFILVLKNPRDNSILINIILGSRNRFEEMQKLTD